MLKKILFLLTLSLVALSLVTLTKAAITNSSRVIPYQGRLTDSSGNNVADGTYAMTFKIYTVSSGGSAAFTESFSAGNAVSVSSGLFSVLLGSLSANGVNLDFANPPYYLGITIAANAEMSPRIQLGFAPLAHNSQYLDGTPLSSFAMKSTQSKPAEGRLTLTSGTPVTTTDVTAATTVYYTPYNGDSIALYDGTSVWNILSFSETSLSLSGYTANSNYDIFAYNNSGTMALESTIWTNDTTRATSLVYQNGILVKSGATTRRYLGTIRITGTTGQTEDSTARRFVSNQNNRTKRQLNANITTSYATTSTTFVTANSNTTDGQGRVSLVAGQPDSWIDLNWTTYCHSTSNNGTLGIGIDSTTVDSADINSGHASISGAAWWNSCTAAIGRNIASGYHYIQKIYRSNSGASTFTVKYPDISQDKMNGYIEN